MNLETKKMNSFDWYKLGKISRTKFIEMKVKIDEEIRNLKFELIKKKEEVENPTIFGESLTRDLMENILS